MHGGRGLEANFGIKKGQKSALHPHHWRALLQPAVIALAIRAFNAVALDFEGGGDKAVLGRPGAGRSGWANLAPATAQASMSGWLISKSSIGARGPRICLCCS